MTHYTSLIFERCQLTSRSPAPVNEKLIDVSQITSQFMHIWADTELECQKIERGTGTEGAGVQVCRGSLAQVGHGSK